MLKLVKHLTKTCFSKISVVVFIEHQCCHCTLSLHTFIRTFVFAQYMHIQYICFLS